MGKPVGDGLVKFSDCTSSLIGLELTREVPYDRWVNIGKALAQADAAIHWWIGDWLRYGEQNYGDKYLEAQEITGFSYVTCRHDKSVAQKFELGRRRPNLDWSFHAEVASFQPGFEEGQQDWWLDKCEAEGWTRARLRREIKNAALLPPLPEGKFDVIYADPPWEYATEQHCGEQQATVLESHYSTLTTERIASIPIVDILPENAALFLWTTSPKLYEAQSVFLGWGFTYKASMIWDKVKHNVGHYVSVRHEILLICTRGSFLPQEGRLFDSVQTIERAGHSEKPQEFRNIIETLYPRSTKLELFARENRDGWLGWGNDECLSRK